MAEDWERRRKDIVRILRYRGTVLQRTLTRLIEGYGIPEVALLGPCPASLLNDYFYFCQASGARCLTAARILHDRGYAEESIALVRSAYEAYLRCSSAWRSATDIELNSLTTQAIRAAYGVDSGREVSASETEGEEATADGKTVKMRRYADLPGLTRCPDLDREVHPWFYEQLCAFAHPDFRRVGSYQRQKDPFFSVDSGFGDHPFALFASLYVGTLLLGEVACFEDVEPPHERIVVRILRGCIKAGEIFAAFASAAVPASLEEFPRNVTKIPSYDPRQFTLMIGRTRKALHMLLESLDQDSE